MKPPLKILIPLVALVLTSCTEKVAEKARVDAEAKARADAAKKEMSTLPKVFSTPDYLKKNEPAKTDPSPKTAPDSEKK